MVGRGGEIPKERGEGKDKRRERFSISALVEPCHFRFLWNEKRR